MARLSVDHDTTADITGFAAGKMSKATAWLVLVTSVFAVGCSVPAPTVRRDSLEPPERAVLSSRTVIVVRRPLPTFQIYSTTDQYLQMVAGPFGLAGIWGAFAAVEVAADHRSDPFIRDNQLADPAYGVAAELGRQFGPRFGVTYVGLTENIVDAQDAKETAESLEGRADFALDLRTLYWGLTTSPLYPTYRFAYRASMHLIDTTSGEALASGQCKYWPASSEAETLEDLTAAKAALLKEKIRSSVAACAAQLTDIVLDRPNQAHDRQKSGSATRD